MGVIGEGVQEQIGQAVARQVIFEWQSTCEQETSGINPARGGLLAQIGLGGVLIVTKQPQHAALDRIQQSLPDIE
jgi:hypothetical protein